MLGVGDVFVWPDFRDGRDPAGSLKPRWFICLGRTSVMADPVTIFLSTTTTQTHYYEKNGSREKHIHLWIDAGQFGFADECVVDFSDAPYDYTAAQLSAAPIEVRGKVDDKQFLRRIYDCILHSPRFSKIVVLDVHESMNRAGITGLKRP